MKTVFKKKNCFLLDRNIEKGEEPVKICIKKDHIYDFGKKIKKDFDFYGESVGFFKFSYEISKELLIKAKEVMKSNSNAVYEEAIRLITKKIGNNAFNLAKIYFQRDDIINKIENHPNDYIIYPNPTRNNSFINLINESSKAISYIEMFDLNGIKQNISIIDGLQRNYRINISNVSSGIYIIYIIFSDGSNKSTKLVIRK